jgi:CheY-like chemotaxis protein
MLHDRLPRPPECPSFRLGATWQFLDFGQELAWLGPRFGGAPVGRDAEAGPGASRSGVGDGQLRLEEESVHAFIIEDEYLIGRTIQDLLTDLGFTVFSFARSEDAAVFAATGAEIFDLVTADVRLLPGDGIRAAEAFRANARTPLVFVTAYAEELTDRLAGRLPDVPVVQKPIKPAEFEAAVCRALEKRRG